MTVYYFLFTKLKGYTTNGGIEKKTRFPVKFYLKIKFTTESNKYLLR